jgi:hypothetical protein
MQQLGKHYDVNVVSMESTRVVLPRTSCSIIRASTAKHFRWPYALELPDETLHAFLFPAPYPTACPAALFVTKHFQMPPKYVIVLECKTRFTPAQTTAKLLF